MSNHEVLALLKTERLRRTIALNKIEDEIKEIDRRLCENNKFNDTYMRSLADLESRQMKIMTAPINVPFPWGQPESPDLFPWGVLTK